MVVFVVPVVFVVFPTTIFCLSSQQQHYFKKTTYTTYTTNTTSECLCNQLHRNTTYALWLYLLYLLYLLFSPLQYFVFLQNNNIIFKKQHIQPIQQIQLQNVSVTNFIATLLTPYGCICCTCCICCFPHYNILSFLTTSECHSYQLHHNLLKPCDRFLII